MVCLTFLKLILPTEMGFRLEEESSGLVQVREVGGLIRVVTKEVMSSFILVISDGRVK